MILFQIILISFAVFMIYVARIHNRKQNISRTEYFFWLATWIGFSMVVIWPASVAGVAESLNIARVFDLLVIIALMFITLLTFYNRILFNKMQEKFERLIRDKALESARKK